MPFVRIPQAVNNAVAFQPDTLCSVRLNGSSAELAMGAYWHERRAGKPLACYGLIFFNDAAGAAGQLDPDLYQDILDKTDNQSGVYAMTQLAGLKVGHSRPYTYAPLFEHIDRSHVDEAALTQMLQSPVFVPPGTDGWFKRPPAYSSEKFWREADRRAGRTR